MKRTQVIRETADDLHTAEAALETALAASQVALERLVLARKQLGLTGTLGDASIARVRESVATMRQARAELIEGHKEAYRIYEMLDLKDSGVTASKWLFPEESTGHADDTIRAA